jgi:integrase
MAGSIRQRPDRGPDAWELRIFLGRDELGRVRHRSVTLHGSKRAAERELARLVAEHDLAPEPPPPPAPWGPRTTINDAIAGWRDNGWQDLSPSTVRGYEGVWRRHVRDSIGRRQIATLTTYEVEQFLRELKAKGMGRTTVRLTRALLHRSCRLARKWSGNTLSNPVNGAELPQWRSRERPAPVRAPEVSEVLTLLEAAKGADPRVGTLIRLVAATGMRRGEACALRWDDVDFEARTIRLDEGVVSADGTAVAREPKTAASVRGLVIDPDTLDAIAALRRVQDDLAEACGLPLAPSAFVFSFDADGTNPPNPDTMSHAFARVRDAAGVAADIHLHSLRHFHSTVLDSVVSEAQKQLRLGWSTVHMARHYTDRVLDEDARAAEYVGQVLASDDSPLPQRGQRAGSAKDVSV